MAYLLAKKPRVPGIRFYPTDEELFMYYLKRKVLGKSLGPKMISDLDVYRYDPSDLPSMSYLKTEDLYWFFFCPRLKCSKGGRANRSTERGYWKSTGNDRTFKYNNRPVGKIKTLIFHIGKPPGGDRTNWVMHEYRLEDKVLADKGVPLDSFVLCKFYEKSGFGPKNGENYGARFVEEEWMSDDEENVGTTSSLLPYPVAEGCGVMNDPSTSVITNTLLSPDTGAAAPIQSTGQPMSSGGNTGIIDSTPLPVVPVETEEDELERMLEAFSDTPADGGTNVAGDDEIFGGLDDIVEDWSKYLAEDGDGFMELNDLTEDK